MLVANKCSESGDVVEIPRISGKVVSACSSILKIFMGYGFIRSTGWPRK